MKRLLITAICTAVLFGCNSEEIATTEKAAAAQGNKKPAPIIDNGIIINESNAKALTALLRELDVYTSLPATLSYNEEYRQASNTNSQCTVSGNLNIDTQSDTNSSTSTFSYENCSYVEGHSLDGSYTTIGNFEEDLSELSIQTHGNLENKLNAFATMMEIDVTINGSKEQYVIDYRFDFNTDIDNIEGDFVIYTDPTLTWNENNKSMVGSVVIEGAEDNTIEMIYNNNGVTYYLNGQLYTP